MRAPWAMRRPYRVAFMYSSSTWFGLKSPEMPAKRYTSVSPTVFRTVTVFPMVRAAIASAAVCVVIVPRPPSWGVPAQGCPM